MRKGRDGGEKNRKKKEEKNDENCGHLRYSQQSTTRTPTAGTPHARANSTLFEVRPASVQSTLTILEHI